MSLTQDHGNHVFICDGLECRSRLETNTSNFESALNLLRRAGWKAIRIGNWHATPGAKSDWANLCGQCVKANVQIPHHESDVRQGELL
jgi:hypothetical protein